MARVLVGERAVRGFGVGQHGGVGFEEQHAAVGQQAEVDAGVVEVHRGADRRHGGPGVGADRGGGVLQEAHLLGEPIGVLLHAGALVVHHPVRRDRQVVGQGRPIHEDRPVLAPVAVGAAEVGEGGEVVGAGRRQRLVRRAAADQERGPCRRASRSGAPGTARRCRRGAPPRARRRPRRRPPRRAPWRA